MGSEMWCSAPLGKVIVSHHIVIITLSTRAGGCRVAARVLGAWYWVLVVEESSSLSSAIFVVVGTYLLSRSLRLVREGLLIVIQKIGLLGILFCGIVAFVLFIYVCGFIFVDLIFYQKSGPKPETKHTQFIDSVSAANMLNFVKTLLTFGFMKASFRRCVRFHQNWLNKCPVAEEGKPALDAKLVSLKDGSTKSLLQDYVLKQPKGKPLILNMGSFS
jgi:hypothetical protein